MNVVHLSPASPTADLRALEEVEDFASTDMGWGGEDTWTYRILPEEQITPELLRRSHNEIRGRVDCVTFQPCSSYEARSQDRYVVQNWDMPGGQWSFSGIFDGHGGHDTVNFVSERLPAKVRASLHNVLANSSLSSTRISQLLGDAITEIDNVITQEFRRLFPDGRDGLSKLGDSELTSIMSRAQAGPHAQNISRCLQGSTALVTLVDPSGSHLWVANLGDCRAVLVSRSSSGVYRARRITDVHNGGNPREVRRIQDEHVREPECVVDNRVLGFLAPTRALGDTWMKLDAVYSRRVLMKSKQFRRVGLHQDHVDRIITPPYLSNRPDVRHIRLRRPNVRSQASYTGALSSGGTADVDVALILCSDGLTDLYEDQDLDEDYYIKRWAAKVGEVLASTSTATLAPPSHRSAALHQFARSQGHARAEGHRSGSRTNLAVHLLRDAIGGTDIHRASANLTVEMDERWMDDTTVLVHRLL